ncbi:hypothetical protein MNV49_003857 [Pseudohyphozyma bogoriensis]|nr:hypothetical protein MNV49_003857 [Pseudohyphozyma bogoriensis]
MSSPVKGRKGKPLTARNVVEPHPVEDEDKLAGAGQEEEERDELEEEDEEYEGQGEAQQSDELVEEELEDRREGKKRARDDERRISSKAIVNGPLFLRPESKTKKAAFYLFEHDAYRDGARERLIDILNEEGNAIYERPEDRDKADYHLFPTGNPASAIEQGVRQAYAAGAIPTYHIYITENDDRRAKALRKGDTTIERIPPLIIPRPTMKRKARVDFTKAEDHIMAIYLMRQQQGDDRLPSKKAVYEKLAKRKDSNHTETSWQSHYANNPKKYNKIIAWCYKKERKDKGWARRFLKGERDPKTDYEDEWGDSEDDEVGSVGTVEEDEEREASRELEVEREVPQQEEEEDEEEGDLGTAQQEAEKIQKSQSAKPRVGASASPKKNTMVDKMRGRGSQRPAKSLKRKAVEVEPEPEEVHVPEVEEEEEEAEEQYDEFDEDQYMREQARKKRKNEAVKAASRGQKARRGVSRLGAK